MSNNTPDGTGLVNHDSWLEPYRDKLQWRWHYYHQKLEILTKAFGSLDQASLGYNYFGFNRGQKDGEPGVWYREWAPGALSLALIGDFNDWERFKHPMKKDQFGVWSIFLPDDKYREQLNGSRVKVFVASKKHSLDRIPAYIRKVNQDPQNLDFYGVYQVPQKAFRWTNRSPLLAGALRIYESHVGMSQEKYGIGTFDEFRTNVLPRIKDQGYNAVQLMAVAQHPYYGSFGYQVSNFFAVSHFMGNDESLKRLVDAAHGLDMVVLMDLVHSHTTKNINEGLNEFDGTDYQYFHAGNRGEHAGWDTKLFNYANLEVQRFLLSNVRYWLEEYNFDGFRFDGVTSMLYKDHGLGSAFDHYDTYFNDNVDEDALVYLKMANQLIHQLDPDHITIAEEVSGMPGLARPIKEGGVGFDYRLAMGIPDYWIKTLKHKRDEDWSIQEVFDTLVNRRRGEKHVAYAESHDQAMVGDKTIAFWLMDKDMYEHMTTAWNNATISRGIALHNLIRLMTFSLGGEAWLNFMGNEFGHPEWIDFPREGNGYSYHYARRQWSLVDDASLRYQHLKNFDQFLHKLDDNYNLLSDDLLEYLWHHQDHKLLLFRRGPLVFVFNLHPDLSHPDLRLGVPDATDYMLLASTDESDYGGFDRLKKGQVFPIQSKPYHNRKQSIQVYIPARTAIILGPTNRNALTFLQ